MKFSKLTLLCGMTLGSAVLAQKTKPASPPTKFNAGVLARVRHNQSRDNYSQYNGVLYTKDVVLSVVDGGDKKPENYEVYLNSKNKESANISELEAYKVDKIIHHPNYYANLKAPVPLVHSDLAVMKLNTDAGECLKVVLEEPGSSYEADSALKLVGWNSPEEGKDSKISVETLNMKALSDEACAKEYYVDEYRQENTGDEEGFSFVKIKKEEMGNYNFNPKVEFCAKGDDKYQSFNRGGALFKDYTDKHPTLVGISSWGTCLRGTCKSAVMVRVSEFSEWIDDSVAEFLTESIDVR